jgi:hypothetical protein
MMITGSVIKSILASDSTATGEFVYAKINLVKAACPKELQASRQNIANNNPIVIEKNRHGYGRASTGYVPAAVVVSGGEKRAALLKKGIIQTGAWIEIGAMTINADDAIGCQELMTKLSQLLSKKFPVNPSLSYPGSSAWVVEVYPFENYMIYCQMGKNYRQYFTLDAVDRNVALQGAPVEVKTTYVNASVSGMGLISQICDGYSDMVAAVSTYLNAIKYGNYIPLQPDFAPVKIDSFGHISNVLAASGINPVDFAIWADANSKVIKEIDTKDKKKKLVPFADASAKMAKLKDGLKKMKAFSNAPSLARSTTSNMAPASMSTVPSAGGGGLGNTMYRPFNG